MSICGFIQLKSLMMLLSFRLLQPSSFVTASSADQHITFKDWRNWMAVYNGCSSTHFKDLAPININTGASVVLDSNASTLFVYPASPTKKYEMKIMLRIANPSVKTSRDIWFAPRILLDTNFDTERTFIEGLGSNSRRYFKSLTFLFSKSDLGPEMSLHQLDDQNVPLELIYIFESEVSDNIDLEISHIHVRVQVGESESPMFHPIIEVVESYNKVQRDFMAVEKLLKINKVKLDKINQELAPAIMRSSLLKSRQKKGKITGAEKVELNLLTVILNTKKSERQKLYKQTSKLTIHIGKQGSYKFVTPFQVSWLLPSLGGYYTYKTQEIFPYCRDQDKNIPIYVMENPIEISQAQLDVLYNMPIPVESELPGYAAGENIDYAIPPIRPLNDRTIYYNPKNLQFLYDDHVHMISLVRKRLKNARLLNKGSPNPFRFEITFTTLVMYFLILIMQIVR